MKHHVTSHNVQLPGNTDASVKRILHHIDRLMAFHTVEWFLQERDKEAVLKMNFTQDKTYTDIYQTENSLPRVRDHMERLSKSHRLREWDLRESDGRATIVVTFQYEEAKSPEDLFFMTSAHLKFVEDPCDKTANHESLEKGDACNGAKHTDEQSRQNFTVARRQNSETESSSGVSLLETFQTPLKETRSRLPASNVKVEELPTLKSIACSDTRRSVVKGEQTSVRAPEKQSKHQNLAATSTKSKAEDKPYTLNTKTPLKSTQHSTRGNASSKGSIGTQNPFSVNIGAASSKHPSSRTQARSIKQPTTRKLGTLQKSKSASSIRVPADTTRRDNVSIQSNQATRNGPKTGFSSSRFTFRKAYNKTNQEEKDLSKNVSMKRKTEHLDDDYEITSSGPSGRKLTGAASVKSTQTVISGRPKSETKATSATSDKDKTTTKDIKGPSNRDKSGDKFNDVYRLYFADSADASLCNNDVLCLRQDYANASPNTHPRQFSSTPSNRQDTSGMSFSAFGDLFKQYFPESTDKSRCNLTDIMNNTDSKPSTTSGDSKDVQHRTHEDCRSSTSGIAESHSSDTESSLENSPQETTLTETSRTSESSEAFSCCTEPCLEESAKVEIQDYYLMIYNQIQKDPRLETDQLVWEIDEAGRICLYHKNLMQTKIHKLVSPEELLEMDQSGTSGVIPEVIVQQYVFRRLLDDIDKVTFDNRALGSAEKKRFDRLMKKLVM